MMTTYDEQDTLLTIAISTCNRQKTIRDMIDLFLPQIDERAEAIGSDNSSTNLI